MTCPIGQKYVYLRIMLRRLSVCLFVALCGTIFTTACLCVFVCSCAVLFSLLRVCLFVCLSVAVPKIYNHVIHVVTYFSRGYTPYFT